MALYVSGHYPNINQRFVPRNPTIRVYFNNELSTSSIDYRVISVHDRMYATVPGTVSWDYTSRGTQSGIASILTFTPTVMLDSETRYNVYVHKQPDSVISMWNEQLVDTYKFTFYTGSGTIASAVPTAIEQLEIDKQHAIDIGNYTEAQRIQDLIDQYTAGTLSGTIPEPTVISSLILNSTYPTNEQPNVTDLRFIELRFNDTIYASGVAIKDYVDVAYHSVLQ
jgi:hypothetical protein